MILASYWTFLLPIAAASGYFAASAGKRNEIKRNKKFTQLSKQYFVGLNYLLNEEQDKALDIFIKVLEVDHDTVETHLALGNLFRRKGEMSRAIRIHQNIIARPNLTKDERIESLLALGQDYLGAGVLDRAEGLFREVIEMGGQHTVAGLKFLLDIYQREKAWKEAIEVADRLASLTNVSMHRQVAHYYCEMAQVHFSQQNIESARKYLKRALLIDKSSVRASLLSAEIDIQEKRYKNALKSLKRVEQQDANFITEALAPIAYCYEQLNDELGLLTYLRNLQEKTPRISVVLLLVERFYQYENGQIAEDFLVKQLSKTPSLRGLRKLIDWQLDHVEGKAREKIEVLKEITDSLLQDKPIYQCDHCGYSGKSLLWLCPSCRTWSNMYAISGVEGD